MQRPPLEHIRALLEQGTQRRQNGRLLHLQMEGHLQCNHLNVRDEAPALQTNKAAATL